MVAICVTTESFAASARRRSVMSCRKRWFSERAAASFDSMLCSLVAELIPTQPRNASTAIQTPIASIGQGSLTLPGRVLSTDRPPASELVDLPRLTPGFRLIVIIDAFDAWRRTRPRYGARGPPAA